MLIFPLVYTPLDSMLFIVELTSFLHDPFYFDGSIGHVFIRGVMPYQRSLLKAWIKFGLKRIHPQLLVGDISRSETREFLEFGGVFQYAHLPLL